MKSTFKSLSSSLRLALVALAILLGISTARAATFVVNTTNDTADAFPGNGNCADVSMQCSLRAAISEANALPGNDIITIPAGIYTQSLVAANDDFNAGGDWDLRRPLPRQPYDQR
jgi:CSLREA domain-containing protein